MPVASSSELDVGGVDQMLHQHKGVPRALADGEQAVIVHDHRAILSEVPIEAFALFEILGDALVGVVADALIEADRLLRHHAQPDLQAGNRHADIGVNVHGAVHVRTARSKHRRAA